MKRKLLFVTLLMLFCTTMFGQQHWTMSELEISFYQTKMSYYTYATIDGVDVDNNDIQIAAFHDNELRGCAFQIYDEDLGYLFMIDIYGTTPGDQIYFKLYKPDGNGGGVEYGSDFTINFNDEYVSTEISTIDFYNKHWNYEYVATEYMQYPCVIKIDGVLQERTNLELAAFCGEELRGVARPQKENITEGLDIYMASLKIEGTNNETISFKLYDPTIPRELSTDKTILFDLEYGNQNVVEIDFRNEAVAQIGSNYYATLQEALKAITSGCTLDILKDITIASDWDCRNTGATITVPVTINGNGKTIKFTGKISDGFNHLAAFRFEDHVTVNNLVVDMSEAVAAFQNRFSAISTKANLTVNESKFIGSTTYANSRAIIFGEGGHEGLEIVVNETEFINWKYGVVDNMNGGDVKSVTITDNTFDNADVVISAKETVTFTGNDMSSDSYVNITSYTVPNNVQVVANNNTNLAANTETECNQIAAPLANINAQDGFLTPVAEAGGKYYVTLQGAVDGVADSGTITLLSDIELAAQDAQELFKPTYNRESYCGVYIPDDKTVVLELNGKTVSYLDTKEDVDNVMVMNLGNLTINDNSAEKTGKITYKPVAGSSQYAKFYSTIFNCGTLTVNAGTIENTAEAETDVTNAVDNHSRLSHEYGNNSILIVNGGTLSGAYYYAIRQYTHYFEGVQNRVVINDGNINGGIYMQHGDNWYYANPESNRLNVDCYLEIKGGNINVNTTSDAFGKIKSRLNNPDNNAFGLNISGGIINVPVELLVQRGVYYENGVSGTTVPAETPGTRNAEWLAKNDGFVQGGTFSQIGGEEEHTTNLELFLKKGYKLEQNTNGTYGVVVDPDYGMVAKIGETRYATLAAAFEDAAQTEELTTIELLPVTIEEDDDINTVEKTIKLPATLKNVIVKGADNNTSILKNLTIQDAQGGTYDMSNITFDGVVFDNSNIVLTGWRTGFESLKNLIVKNCIFSNIVRSPTNLAAVHINVAADKAVNGFTFINNVIDGVTGAQNSGIYGQFTGEVIVKDNVINNVAFRPYVIQLTTDDGIDDEFTVTGNTFSGSAAGRAQGLGNNAEGTDAVTLTVSNNIFKDITNAQQICYWNFNEATTTSILEKNYYDIDVLENPNRIYYNGPAQNISELSEMGIFPIYTELNADGTINEESLFNPVAYNGTVAYETLAEAFAGQDGTIVLLENIELTQGLTVAAGKTFTLDLNGKVVSGVSNTAATSAVITNNGNLTVKTSVEGGKITSKANNPDQNSVPAYANNTITNCGVLTLLSGTIENSTEQGLACFPIDNNSTVRDAVLNINGGTVTGRGAIRQFANSNTNKNEVNVTAGTVTGTSYAIWVQNPVSGDPKASLNIEDGELSKILMDPNANFEGSIKGGTITEVAIWEPDATNPGRNPSGFITGGTFGMDVTEFCAEGFIAKVNTGGTYDVRFADYIVLPTGMDESNYETLFGTNTVTDGTNYYATMKAALQAVYGTENAILYCKPGANVGQMTHGAIKQTLTVYGNGAYTSGNGDFDIGNCNYQGNEITNDITLTVKYLDGCGAWGYKNTEHTVNIIFENCKDMSEVYLTGIAGATNITMNNCEFTDNVDGGNCKVYSNANGNITLTGMLFRNVDKAVNLNHKAAGTQTVTLENCTFTNCGNDVAEDQIPVRVLSSVEGGSSVLTVNACTFTGTPEGGADILLDYGIGLTTATVSNTAAYVVVEREANVQTDKTTTLADQTYTFDNRPYVAEVKVGEDLYKYITIADALTAVPDGGTITLINNATEEFAIEDGKTVTLDMATYTLTGAITPSNAKLTIKNGTINNENASYSAIEINAGTLVLNDVKVTSKRHGVRIDGAVEATIEGGEYRLSATSGTRHAVNVSGAANVTITDGIFVGPKGTTMDSGSAVCVQLGAEVTIEGGDFSGGKNATLGVSGEMIVTGGTFDQDVTAYCAVGYLCELNDETGKYEVFRGLTGKGTETEPYLIQNLSDLVFFRDDVNKGEETRYNAPCVWVALGADIDMTGVNWTPSIGLATTDHGFMGNFDGKTYKIKNLTITNPALDSDNYAYAGLFGVTEGTDKDNQNTIKNLTIENVTISTTGHIVSAAIAYPYYTIVDNVKVCGNINITGGNYTSGVLAYTRRCVNASNLTIVGNQGSTITGNQVVGGVISDIQMNGGLTAEYSNFNAEGIKVTGEMNVGGISGIIAAQTLNTCSVKNVTLACSDNRVGIVSGALGGASTITNVTVDNVTGATNIIGATYDGAKAIEAKIGDTYYATLKHAITAAQANETITLLANVELAETATIEKAITLDLNGMNVTVADDAIVFNVKATMTLDGTITGNINLATAESVLIGAQTLNVTTDLSGYIVVYENGQYKLTQGQRVQLANGWNWYSSYINDEVNALEKLQAALGTKGVQIKDDVQYTNYYTDYGWYGRLTTIAPNEKMYMIKTSADTEIEIRGEKVDPNTITITIKPGWNYIPYPLDVAQSITTALGIDFEPQKDDVIKGKGSTAVYVVGTNGQGWLDEFNMEPGQGYMYKSNATSTMTFNYSYPTGGAKSSMLANVETIDYHWTVDAHKYANSMNMIAMVNVDGEMVKGGYEVAAFSNEGECRGTARPFYVEDMDAYLMILTIHGEEVENLTFRYYDIDTDTEYELNNVVTYSDNAIVGTIDNPYIFTMNILGIGENSIDNINIYPNPTTTDREINLNATFDKVEVYNALGVKVVEYQNVDTIDALGTAGIYVIRVTDNNGDVKHCRLVVK